MSCAILERYLIDSCSIASQGLGLFAGRDLEKHTMVIEYIGELIRNEVANKREKLYEQQNRGIYMFRLDEENVVDATMSGCLARYINHSCEVNSSWSIILSIQFYCSSLIQLLKLFKSKRIAKSS
jgi:SET domain-containing protein